MLVSVVIPCYNSERSIAEVVELTMAQFDRLADFECEFVLVNDGSPADDTYGAIRGLALRHRCVHGVNLMRNFGQPNAQMCGLGYAKGELILGMDDDLQTHPSQIPTILEAMASGTFDVVYGVYPESKNGLAKDLTSWLNKVTARKLLGRPKGIRSSNFWCITRQLRDQVILYTNYNPQLDALFTRLTTHVGNVEIKHHERAYGESGYTLGKLVRLWLSYFNYTVLPLRLASGMGVACALAGFVALIVTVLRKLLDPGIAAGWASIISIMFLFFGLVLLVLGIIGEYLGDMVLSVNSSPQYIVRETVNLDE